LIILFLSLIQLLISIRFPIDFNNAFDSISIVNFNTDLNNETEKNFEDIRNIPSSSNATIQFKEISLSISKL